jgi:hypothetical protein
VTGSQYQPGERNAGKMPEHKIPEEQEDAIAKIYRVLGPHVVLLPIPKGLKHPIFEKWQKTTWEQTQEPRYQQELKPAGAIGVLLGAPSGDLCALDIDIEGDPEKFLALNPQLAGTLATYGSRGRNFWLRCRGDYPQKVLHLRTKDWKTGDPDWEWRGAQQSVVWGFHPETKKPYQWLAQGPIIEIEFASINWPTELILPWARRGEAHQPKEPKPKKEQDVEESEPLAHCLADHILEFCQEWVPLGEQKGDDWAIGNDEGDLGQSLRISLTRKKAGQWIDFNGHEGGSFLSLLVRLEVFTTEAEALEEITGRYPDYFERAERAVIYHAGRDKGLLNFCYQVASALNEKGGEIYSSCGACVAPVRKRVVGEVEVTRLSLAELSAQAFKSEIQKYLVAYRHTDSGRLAKSLTTDLARTVLESRAFLDTLQPIRGVCDLALPCAISPQGELLAFAEGFNRESGILVKSDGFGFEHDWPLEKAVRYYRGLYREFCFPKADLKRSLAVAVAMNLTLFGHYLLDPSALRPAFIADANKEGAGKSLLVKIALIGRYGAAVLSAMPANEDQCQKQIFSAARCRDGVVAWDNVHREIKSASLEQAITSVYLSDRLLHTHTTQGVRHELTFLLTTNGGVISSDLRRRSLSMELHLSNLKAEDRLIKHWLEDGRLTQARPQLCAAAWALLRHWAACGCPEPRKVLPGFEKWSLVIGGAVEAAGFVCPTKSPHSRTKGVALDAPTLACEELVTHIAKTARDKMLAFDSVWEIAVKLPAVKDALLLEDSDEAAARRRLGVFLKRFDGVLVKNVYLLTRYKITSEKYAIKVTLAGSAE